MWKVYGKNDSEKYSIRKVEYFGGFMDRKYVVTTIKSSKPVDFQMGDYFTYRGERFTLNYIPSVSKKSSIDSIGDAFIYENIIFNSYSDELIRCEFLDYVLHDNVVHFSSLPTFGFYAASVRDLADRVQANLNRVYTGSNRWIVTVHSEFESPTGVFISINKSTIWDALSLLKTKFNANFIIRGRNITIGTAGQVIDNVFEYGKGKGLVKIEKLSQSDQQIITRLRVYGSTRNIPHRYYNKLSNASLGNYLPDNMAVHNLMLPSFPYETLDPFLDSENIGELGIMEGSVFFDGSNELLPEIYPSMEGMTAQQLRNTGITVDLDAGDNGNLDEVAVGATNTDDTPIDDNGIFDEGETVPSFKISLKDVFGNSENLADIISDGASISFKSGMCAGREFEIIGCEKSGNKYILTCNRVEDQGINLFFPYKDYPILSGDKFVLLNIEMPEVYVKAASQRLLEAGKEYLSKNDYVRYTYQVKLSPVLMARNPSLSDSLIEGDYLMFTDDDLGVDGSIIIDTLRIKEGEDAIPSYEVTLSDEKQVGAIQKMQNQIDMIISGGNRGFNEEQVKSLVNLYGSRLFLSKLSPDTAKEVITFLKGWSTNTFSKGTSGSALYPDEDGNWHIQAEYVHVLRKLTAGEIEIQKTSHIGGKLMQTAASMSCIGVEEHDSFYRCFIRTEDNEGRRIYNQFKVNDQALVETFNLLKQADGTTGNHFLWRLVVGVGENYIDLSKSICAVDSDIPLADDNIVQLGYQGTDDPDRQNAIIMAGAGEGSPYFKQYVGIKTFSLPPEETRLKPGDNLFTGKLNIQPGSTGAANLGDLPDEVVKAVQVGSINLLRNSGFTGDYETIDVDTLDISGNVFSDPLKFWTGSATVQQDSEAVSGFSAVIGSLEQEVKLIHNENYVVSLKAKGGSVSITCGGFSANQVLSGGYEKHVFRFKNSYGTSFRISGNATICDLQLERGTVETDYSRSILDNDKSLIEALALQYLTSSINNASTTTLGGLILSNIMMMGNYVNKKMVKVTAGVSGVYNNDDDPSVWSGGTLEQAIRTVQRLKENPYSVTDEEWKDLAKIVLTHGGDGFFRGFIYALGGIFRGRVESNANGNRILIDPETRSIRMISQTGRDIVRMQFSGERIADIAFYKYNDDGTHDRITTLGSNEGYFVQRFGVNGDAIDPIRYGNDGQITNGYLPNLTDAQADTILTKGQWYRTGRTIKVKDT